MPVTTVKSPTGDLVQVQHPEGASDDDILSYAQQNYATQAVGPDIAQSVAGAPRKVAEGMVSLPGNLSMGLNKGIDWLLGTNTPESSRILPTSADVQAKTSQYLGPSYQPQTPYGKYAGAATEGAIGGLLGPGSTMAKLLIGGASGLGSEAGQENLPGHPILGGLAGGLVGGAGAIGAGKATEALRNYFSAESAGKNIGNILGTGNVPPGAVRRVATSAQQDELNLPDALAMQQKLGPDEAMIMDMGRQLQGRAEQMAVQPGQAQNTVLNAVEGRTGEYGSGAAQRIGQTLTTQLGPSQDVVKLIDRVDQMVQAQAGPAYKQVMDKYQNISVPAQITQRPAVQTAMDQASGIAANYGKSVSAEQPNLEYWDYVKKGMDHRINGMMRSGIDDLSSSQKADLGGLIDAKQSLVSHLDQVTNGEYANARQIASTKPELHEALDFGRSIFSSKLLPEEVKAQIGDLSIPGQTMAQVGARRELERVLGNVRNEGAKARAFLDTNNNTAKISALFGPQAAQAIQDRVAAENAFQMATENVARNSRTAVRTELAKDTTALSPGDFHTTAFGAVTAPFKTGLAYALQSGMANTRSGISDILTAKGKQLGPVVEQLLNYNKARAAHQTAPVGQQTQAMIRALLAQGVGR